MKPDLTNEETDALARLLRDTIHADRYPFSLRVQRWSSWGGDRPQTLLNHRSRWLLGYVGYRLMQSHARDPHEYRPSAVS